MTPPGRPNRSRPETPQGDAASARETDKGQEQLAWLPGNGEMAGRIRNHDWAATPLGSVEGWSSRLRVMVEQVLASPLISTLVCGPDLILVYNDVAARLYGDRHPAALGCSLPRTFAEGWAAVAPLYARVFAGESVLVASQPLDTRGEGEPTADLFDAVLVPVREDDGQVAYAHMTGVEVGGRARAEVALRESEAQLRDLVDTLDLAAILVRDLDGTIRFWSRGCERLYGWTAEEAVGQSAHDLLRTEFPVPLAEIEATLLREGEWRGDFVHRRRDGGRLVVAVHKILRRDDAGRPVAIAESLADVTALRQAQDALQHLNETLEQRVEERTAELMAAEETLRQSQKMEAVGHLTGGIAQDFNNMLQAIGGGLEMMQRRIQQGRVAEAEQFVKAARMTIERAAALTHRLLAFARKQALQPKLVDLDELVKSMAGLIQRTVGPSVQVELRMGGSLWPVLCDPNQLESALLNLAINACDAMPDGGRLTISMHHVTLSAADVVDQEEARPGEHVEVAVADTGAGMDDVSRAHAFEPFFTTKPLGQGTGLGLSQLYGFVRQSYGAVRLDSVPGQGTTVRLFLPRHVKADEPETESAGQGEVSASQAATGAGGTVLLVEDETQVRAVTAGHLRELGYQVLETADGPAALRLLRSGRRLDVLITDVGLPGGINGRQVADAARERRPDLPVLFMTGYAGVALRAALPTGMAVIDKPFALEDFTERVGVMLETARSGR